MFAEQGKSLDNLFSRGATVIKEIEPEEVLVVPPVREKPYMSSGMSLAQIKEREERTVFVGNVQLDTKRKHIKAFFTPYGKVEKVWIRSVPVESSKVSKKGLVALKKLVTHADSMNAYVLFTTKEDAIKATEASNSELRGMHIRVTLANQKEMDFKTTIFVGNLNFTAKEEELRKLFDECGKVDMVRIIRDRDTHRGKGIAYVKFATVEGFLNGLKKNKTMYMDRELRIKKAISKASEEKLKFKTKEAQIMRKRKANNPKGDDSDIKMSIMKNFHDTNQTDENDMTAERIEAIFKHNGVVPQSVIGKRIKKLKKQGLEQHVLQKKISKVTKSAHNKIERDVLAKGDQMAQRRVIRKKKLEKNVIKARSYKKTEKPTKGKKPTA